MSLKYYNTPPYYDDFDQTKNYLRILFRPGQAVQARELTQMQTALQAQIDRHGRYTFKEGTPVLGGNTTLDTKLAYIKVESSFTSSGGANLIADNYYDEFLGTVITGQTSGVTAKVIDVLPAEGANPITLYVKYTNSGSDNVTKTFSPLEELLSDGITQRLAKVKDAASAPIGYGSRFSIDESVFFVNGNFVYAEAESMIISRYTSTPSTRIVYEVAENIVTSAEDATLSDNALGTPNEAAPGAHRYQITLTLRQQPFSFTEVRLDNIIQLMVIEEGNVKARARTENSELGDLLATRTYEESGNYVVRPFLLNMRELYNDGTNGGLYSVSQLRSKYDMPATGAGAVPENTVLAYGENRLAIGLEKSTAYVYGYRVELEDVKYIDLLKARDTDEFNGASVVAKLGNFVYVNVTQSLPDVDNFTLMNLRNSSNTTIGTARARSIEKVSGTLHKLYLFDVVMNSGQVFSSVNNVQQTITGGAQFLATINVTYGSKLYDTNYNSLVFQLPFSTVKTLLAGDENDTFYVSKKTYYGLAVTSSTTTISIEEGVFQSFNSNDWIATNTSTGAAVAISGVDISYNVNTGVSTAVVTFSGFSSGTANVIAPIEKNLSRKTKTLISNHEIQKTSPNTTPGGYDPLGLTDVISIVSIKDTGVVIGGQMLDITDRYELDNGQRDNFYDLARIRLKQGVTPPVGNLQIVLNYFQHSTGDYFSVDSYTGIDYEDIPAFQSAKGVIQLRDAIDFRPTKDITGNDFTGTGSSTVDIIKPGSIIKADITYYLNRIDKVYVNKYGDFGIVQGISALNPESPRDPQDSMILYELFVGSYTFGPESIVPKMIDNKRYTMRDIGKLDRRIKNLEYYTSLSLLEKETADYELPSGSFKNGFVVDNFYGHNVGNPSHPDYSCSVDRSRGILRPQFVEDYIRLLYNNVTSTGMRRTGPLVTLDYTEVGYIAQPYASYSEFINPYNIFSWTGDMKLSPETDNWKDTESRPEVVIDQEGVYDSFRDLADAAGVTGTVWNEWQTNWSGVVSSTSSSVSSAGRNTQIGNQIWSTTNTATTTITTTQTNQSRSGIRTDVVPDTVTTDLGQRVVEVNFVPFIRSRIVSFKAERLKPNTQVFAFFDGKDVTAYATATEEFFTYDEFSSTNPAYTSSHTFNGRTGWPTEIMAKTDLITDANGTVTGFFIVPNNAAMKFKTGQRVFKLCDDADNITANITTSAEAVYEAAGLLESNENVVLSTRVPRVERSSLSDSRVLLNSTSSTSNINSRNQFLGWVDPLAQTIMVDNAGGIFATSLDLYFAEIDPEVPVSVHLVTTEVGLPTQKIVPFTKVTRLLTSANRSTDASVATRFTFEAPVHLQQGVEYAIVIMSMSDKPKVWVSEMGGYDVTNPTYRISKQPYAGVFFKSQNASTWTPEQTKDLKFALNRANFTSTSGTVYFNNAGIQYRNLTVDPISTTNGSTGIKVYHKNHGMFNGSYVTIQGVVATSGSAMNGIPITDINKQHLITRVERDYYYVTVATAATSTGRSGGSAVKALENKLMNAMNVNVQQLVIPGTDIEWEAKTVSGQSLASSDQPYVATQYFPIIPNENTLFTRLQCVPSTDNQPGGVPGFTIRGSVSSSTGYLSPVIDLERMSVVTVANLIDNPSQYQGVDGTNYVANYVPETVAKDTSADCKYITRRVALNDDANQIKVIISVNRPSGSDIEVYYKVQAADDGKFDDLPWVLQAPDEPIPFDENSNSYTEVEYSIDDELGGVEFSSMAFKIVLKARNSSFVPTIKDFRAIAIYG